MPLHHLSQPNLERSIEILINNGSLPQAQNAIAVVGYHPESLQQGAALLNTWRSSLTQAQTLLTGQKRATQTEQQARRAAQKEVSRLTRTVQTLFGRDETALSFLGLRSPRRTNGVGETNGAAANGQSGENGTEPQASRVSQSAAATIVRWRRMLANAQNLEEGYKTRLAAAGWPVERIAGAAVLVEVFAQADTQQQEAIHAYRVQIAATKTAELALREWYKEARQLVRLAIEQTVSNDKTQLRELLAL